MDVDDDSSGGGSSEEEEEEEDGDDASLCSSSDDGSGGNDDGDADAPADAHTYLGSLADLLPPAQASGDAATPQASATLPALPLLVVPGMVLFPGTTLPLRQHLVQRWQGLALERVLAAPGPARGLLAVCDALPAADGSDNVCCVARVARVRRRHGGAGVAVAVVARGVARAAVLRVHAAAADGELSADLQLLHDADAPPLPPPGCAHHAGGVWQRASARSLAARLRDAPAVQDVTPHGEDLADKTPTALAYWAASALPLDVQQRKARACVPSYVRALSPKLLLTICIASHCTLPPTRRCSLRRTPARACTACCAWCLA
jgi:hypothetical protein